MLPCEFTTMSEPTADLDCVAQMESRKQVLFNITVVAETSLGDGSPQDRTPSMAEWELKEGPTITGLEL